MLRIPEDTQLRWFQVSSEAQCCLGSVASGEQEMQTSLLPWLFHSFRFFHNSSSQEVIYKQRTNRMAGHHNFTLKLLHRHLLVLSLTKKEKEIRWRGKITRKALRPRAPVPAGPAQRQAGRASPQSATAPGGLGPPRRQPRAGGDSRGPRSNPRGTPRALSPVPRLSPISPHRPPGPAPTAHRRRLAPGPAPLPPAAPARAGHDGRCSSVVPLRGHRPRHPPAALCNGWSPSLWGNSCSCPASTSRHCVLSSCPCLPGRRGWSLPGYTLLPTSFCFSWLLVKNGDVTAWLNDSRKHQIRGKKFRKNCKKLTTLAPCPKLAASLHLWYTKPRKLQEGS